MYVSEQQQGGAEWKTSLHRVLCKSDILSSKPLLPCYTVFTPLPPTAVHMNAVPLKILGRLRHLGRDTEELLIFVWLNGLKHRVHWYMSVVAASQVA